MPFPENLLNTLAEASMEASKKNCPENNPVQILELEIKALKDQIDEFSGNLQKQQQELMELLRLLKDDIGQLEKITEKTDLVTSMETSKNALLALLQAKTNALNLLKSAQDAAISQLAQNPSPATTPQGSPILQATSPPRSEDEKSASVALDPMGGSQVLDLQSQNILEMRRELPLFSTDNIEQEHRLITDPDVFLQRFSIVLCSFDVPKSSWYKFLPLVCNSEHAARLIKNIGSPDTDPSLLPNWDKITAIFTQMFDKQYQIQIKLQKLSTASMSQNESVKEFANRFQTLLKDADKLDSDMNFSKRFLSLLPKEIQKEVEADIEGIKTDRIATVSQLAMLARAYDTISGSADDLEALRNIPFRSKCRMIYKHLRKLVSEKYNFNRNMPWNLFNSEDFVGWPDDVVFRKPERLDIPQLDEILSVIKGIEFSDTFFETFEARFGEAASHTVKRKLIAETLKDQVKEKFQFNQSIPWNDLTHEDLKGWPEGVAILNPFFLSPENLDETFAVIDQIEFTDHFDQTYKNRFGYSHKEKSKMVSRHLLKKLNEKSKRQYYVIPGHSLKKCGGVSNWPKVGHYNPDHLSKEQLNWVFNNLDKVDVSDHTIQYLNSVPGDPNVTNKLKDVRAFVLSLLNDMHDHETPEIRVPWTHLDHKCFTWWPEGVPIHPKEMNEEEMDIVLENKSKINFTKTFKKSFLKYLEEVRERRWKNEW